MCTSKRSNSRAPGRVLFTLPFGCCPPPPPHGCSHARVHRALCVCLLQLSHLCCRVCPFSLVGPHLVCASFPLRLLFTPLLVANNVALRRHCEARQGTASADSARGGLECADIRVGKKLVRWRECRDERCPCTWPCPCKGMHVGTRPKPPRDPVATVSAPLLHLFHAAPPPFLTLGTFVADFTLCHVPRGCVLWFVLWNSLPRPQRTARLAWVTLGLWHC